MTKKLLDYVDDWKKDLQNCQYAGEIFLSLSELNELAKEYISFSCQLEKDREKYELILVVLAVNCTYHYYDDEGFWKHFCALLEVNNTSAQQRLLGDAIENRLMKLGLLRMKRSGPFRYVGAVLEQCGVSRRHIARLAYIINDLIMSPGHEKLLGMGHFKYQKRIENTNCSSYLKDFLLDVAGWQFIMHIIEIVSYYENGTMSMSELIELPGYQPGFWEEFFDHFENVPSERKSYNKVIFKPRMVFVEEELCLGLSFSNPSLVNNIVEPSAAGNWMYPLTRLNTASLLSERYRGLVKLGDESIKYWEVKAWIPDGTPVLFDIKYGLIHKGSIVYPGEYYLLAPFSYIFSGEIRREIGQVKLFQEFNYMAYLVNIKEGQDLPGYIVQINDNKGFELHWINPDEYRLKYSNVPGVEVFSGEIPEIDVSNFSAIESNRVGLFCDIGNGVFRIRRKEDLKRFREEVKQQAPLAGRIWLSIIGRSNTGRQKLDFLEFYLLPECSIYFEERLYTFNDKPTVTFKGPPSCNLEMPGLKKGNGKGDTFIVSVQTIIAVGYLRCIDFSIGIKIPIYRAGVFDLQGRPVRYICTAIKNEQKFIITGIPDSKGSISFHERTEFKLEVFFDQNGQTFIDLSFLLEQLQGGPPVDEITVMFSGYVVYTGAVVIYFDRLTDMLCKEEFVSVKAPSASNLRTIVEMFHDIASKKLAAVNLSCIPSFTPEIDDCIKTMLSCGIVFDEIEVTAGDVFFEWDNNVYDENLRNILKICAANDDSCFEVKTIPDLNCLPDVKRWRNKAREKVKICYPEGRKQLVKEWAKEIVGGYPPYKSQMALLDDCNIIGMAWRNYLDRHYQRSIEEINNISSDNSFLRELSAILHSILLLRMARFDSAMNLLSSFMPRKDMTGEYNLLSIIVNNVKGRKMPLKANNQFFYLDVLPLRAEDILLFQTAEFINRGEDQNILESCLNSNDWLLLYLVINYFNSGKEMKILLSKAFQVKETIPDSPEKKEILDRLYYYQGRK